MSTSKKLNTIALVDWSKSGHHPIYMETFARSLLKADYDVSILWPNKDDFSALREEYSRSRSKSLAIAPFHRIRAFSLWPKPLRKWVEIGAFIKFFKQGISQTSLALGREIDFIFFNCLYEHHVWQTKRLVRCAFTQPWSGLYLHSLSFAPHQGQNRDMLALLHEERLKAFGVLDERTIKSGEATTHRKVIRFPDFAATNYYPLSDLAQKLKRFANGDKLIILIGHLLPSKGVATLAEAALNSNAGNLKFAFIGECNLNSGFSGHERKIIKSAMDNTKNCFFHLHRVADESTYNACIQASDVIFAAYHDFAHSSNTLTKAAFFQKPIIVSEGHLMAERVNRYNLGEVVLQKDPLVALSAMREITDNYESWESRRNPRWSEYYKMQSPEALSKAFSDLFAVY